MRYLEIITAIETISKAGSVRKAAELLAITPSALNRKLLNLEGELGCDLFERIPSGLRMNSAGEIFLSAGKQQLALAESSRARIADLAGFRAGHVEIAASQSTFSVLLPEAIRGYRSAFPAVTFRVHEVDPEQAEDMLSRYEVDLALIYLAKIKSSLSILHQWDQRIVAVMDRHHPLAGHEGLELYECCQYPLALPSSKLGLRQMLDFEADRLDLTLGEMVTSDHLDFLLQTVLGNDLMTFRISESISPNLTDLGWACVPVHGTALQNSTLSLAQLKGRTLSVAAAQFAQHIMI